MDSADDLNGSTMQLTARQIPNFPFLFRSRSVLKTWNTHCSKAALLVLHSIKGRPLEPIAHYLFEIARITGIFSQSFMKLKIPTFPVTKSEICTNTGEECSSPSVHFKKSFQISNIINTQLSPRLMFVIKKASICCFKLLFFVHRCLYERYLCMKCCLRVKMENSNIANQS